MVKTIAISGASGFLGSSILAACIDSQNCEVLAISSRASSLLETESVHVLSNADFLQHPNVLTNCDVFINCAFPRSDDSKEIAQGIYYLNQLLSIVGASRVPVVIDISSQSVYSQKRSTPAVEKTPVCLESSYAVAKYAIECLCDAYCLGSNVVHIRLGSLVGPTFSQRLPNRLTQKALSAQALEVVDLGHHFGYLDIEDATEAIMAVAFAPAPPRNSCYNLGGQGYCTITDQAKWITDELSGHGYHIELLHKSGEIEDAPINSEVNSTLFESEYNWLPKYSIEESVRRIVKYYIARQDK